MQDGSRRAILAAFFANLGIALAKLVGFVFTRAASLLAEAIHSLADTGNQGLLLLGGRQARRAASAEHPFGYGRDRYFWSFMVALVLFSFGGVFAITEGVSKLGDPHAIESPAWALGILGVALVLEGFSLRTAVDEASHAKGDESWWSFIRHSKSPELPVVLLEDSGALLGLLAAFAGVSVAVATGDSRWDAAGSLVIGVLLVLIAGVLAVEMKSLLIGESASPTHLDAIRAALVADEVRSVIHMRTEHIGPDELLVAAKIELAPDLTTPELAAAINRAEERLRAAVPIARIIYLEPDVPRS